MQLPLSIAVIRHLEELATAAWPPAQMLPLTGWRLRRDVGVSRRANSVQTLEFTDGNLPAAIQQVEEAYERWGLPPRFQLCPASQPVDLDQELERRGYVLEARTAVQVAATAEVRAAASSDRVGEVEVQGAPDERWWSVYGPSEGGGAADLAARQAILARVRNDTGYATLAHGNDVHAVGLAVACGEWAGIFCIATAPEYRRQGAATAVLASLAEWSGKQGGANLYLQVMESNRAALPLYERLGFRTAYHYHYRTHPEWAALDAATRAARLEAALSRNPLEEQR